MQSKLKAILVDLDGTLCDVEHRVHHVQGSNKNWKAFNELMVHDELNHWCFELMAAMTSRDYKIIFVTGRGEANRAATENWLKKHSVDYEHLYMRGLLDQREDADVKEDIYYQKIEQNYQVLFVVDDRKSVVERWRKLELICLQCAPGNF
ncbi:MAG: HAD family acid phosphatase [Bacteriovorax sp.]|nr:HAD family acid phosphatase [Bacteriovorax sp.]